MARTRLTEMFFSTFPPPTEKTRIASRCPTLEIFSRRRLHRAGARQRLHQKSAQAAGCLARRSRAGLDARARIAPEQTDLMILRGWSYYHLLRYEEAVRLFEAVAASGHDEALAALGIVRAALVSGGKKS